MKSLVHFSFVIILLTFLFTNSEVNANIGTWKSITNKSKIEDIAVDENLLICVTNGGLLVFDKVSETIIGSFTNTEGLSNNHPVRVVVDKRHNWWVGMSNGDLNFYDQATQEWMVFGDFSGLIIHDMVLTGDSLFVALDIGLSVFLLDKNEAKETYKNLGSFPVEVDVFSSHVNLPYIWVCTDFGIAFADLNQINLKAPQSWQNITTNDGLASNKVKAIQYFDDSYFIGSDAGIQKYEDGIFTTYSGLPANIIEFVEAGNELYLATNSYIYQYDQSSDNWNKLFTSNETLSSLVIENSVFWLGTQDSGLFKWNSTNQNIQVYQENAPNGNAFLDLKVDQVQNLWCATGDLLGKGVYRFDGENWMNFSAENGDIPINRSTTVNVDLTNQIWIGSHGRGVFRFTPDGTKIDIFNAQNGYLAGIPNDQNYSVVWDVAIDQIGTVWLANYGAHNGNKLVAVTPDSQWVYFSSNDGLTAGSPTMIAVDQTNRKWVGTETAGIFVYNDNYTPIDKSDDSFAGTLTQSDGLESNFITALAIDDFNIVWIGTNSGLNYYQDGRVFTKYGLITNDINCISIDPVGNKWIGTSSGFSILDRDDLTFQHYTIDNSPLVSENVLSIEFNKKTGMAYIGTSNGLSIFETLYVEPKKSLDELFVYPNPLILTGINSNPRLIIDQLCSDCDVNVYTASGFLVRKLVQGSRGGRAVWNGRNDENELVASGVYLIVAAQSDGVSRSAKVAVINR